MSRPPICALLALALALAAAPAALAKPAACDQACLTALAERYVDAMVAKAPASLPWADTVRNSEDGVPMMIGDALWASISKAQRPALVAADAAAGQVLWLGVVEEHGEPSFLALRLKAEGGRIGEAEAVLRRKGGPAPFGDTAAFTPDPAFAAPLPPADRRSRTRLVALARVYLDSLQDGGGKAIPAFSAACVRRDNGADTTAGDQGAGAFAKGCEGQVRAGAFGGLARVRARAFPIVDEARGLVVATGVMDYPVRSDSFRTTDGRVHKTATKYPVSMPFIAVFRIEAGRISRIETVYTPAPYLMPSPWTK